MKNKDIKPVHLNGKTPEARERERRDKSNLCRLTITVHKQTAWHLNTIAKTSCRGDIGRVIDKLVRSHQLSMQCFKGGADIGTGD